MEGSLYKIGSPRRLLAYDSLRLQYHGSVLVTRLHPSMNTTFFQGVISHNQLLDLKRICADRARD